MSNLIFYLIILLASVCGCNNVHTEEVAGQWRCIGMNPEISDTSSGAIGALMFSEVLWEGTAIEIKQDTISILDSTDKLIIKGVYNSAQQAFYSHPNLDTFPLVVKHQEDTLFLIGDGLTLVFLKET